MPFQHIEKPSSVTPVILINLDIRIPGYNELMLKYFLV
jgi:hypothetical protein